MSSMSGNCIILVSTMVGVSIISGMKCVNIPSVDGKASLLAPDVVTDKIYSEISVQKIVQIKNRQKKRPTALHTS